MHPSSWRLVACSGLLAALAGCGGGGSAALPDAAATSLAAVGATPASAPGAGPAPAPPSSADAGSTLARQAAPALAALQDLGSRSVAAPGLGPDASVAVAALQGGGFAVAWLVPGAGGANASVQVQAFNPRGEPQDAALAIALDRPLASAGLGVLADGSLVVAFSDAQQDPASLGLLRRVLALHLDRQGQPLAAPQVLRQQASSLMAPSGPAGAVRVLPTRDGGFALAWAMAEQLPGQPARLWAEAQVFDAAAQPASPLAVMDPRVLPSPAPDLTRIADLPGGGVLLPQPLAAGQAAWQPLGSSVRSAALPAAGGLAAGTQVQPLEDGGYVTLGSEGLRLYGNDGAATGTPLPLAVPGRLVALTGGGFAVLAWDGSAQAYDAAAQPQGGRFQAGLAQAPQPPLVQALASGGLALVQPQAGTLQVDVLAPAR